MMGASGRVSDRLLGVAAIAAFAGMSSSSTLAAPPTDVDLSKYVRVGRFDLPEPTRTAHPVNSLLAQEASAVTYDWDTDTLFVVGDGGTSVVQVTKSGALIDSMTLAPGNSPQGTDFYDTEGLTYVGNGKFVLVEERDRQLNLFTYVAGGTLTHAAAQTVKLGTFVGNIGIEGASYDPFSSGFVCVKETSPEGIFQTGVDFAAGTATNGSPSTTNSVDLFNPALAGLNDFADVFSLSNVPSLAGHADASHILILSQESGKIVNIDRSGVISSSLTIQTDPGNPLSVANQQHEGLTMDRDGNLYVVNENGGGDFDHPQLWVYAPSTGVNQAPTALVLNNPVASILENTSTATRIKVADVAVVDDGLGTNNLSVGGADAASFEVDSSGLYIKAGVVLDYETKTSYSITVAVDDPTVGASPDATTTYNLVVVDIVNESASGARVIITEAAAWGSGNSPYAADWFEVTNIGSTTASLTGWKMDDNSNGSPATAEVALNGVAGIAPGQSVVFIETTSTNATTVATTINNFKNAWFGSHVPAGFTIGWYSGGGVGLSTGGDAVNLFDNAGVRVTGVQFAASPAGPTFATFDNTVGSGSTTLPLPFISTLSAVGTNGAFVAVNDSHEVGSPGRITNHAPVANAGPDQTVEATGPTGAPVTLTGAASFDADGDFLTYAWSMAGSPLATGVGPTVTLPIGVNTATLTVTDGFGGSATDTVQITVRDTTGPAISGTPDGITVEATSAAGAVVTFTAPTAVDLVDGVVPVVCTFPSGSTFPIGSTLNTCTATDSRGNSSSSSFRVVVRDTTAPTITVTGLPTSIWPRQHALQRARPTVHVADAVDGAPRLELTITSSEADSGLNSEDVAGDIVIRSPTDFDLRAERIDAHLGRTYTLTWTATDASGNVGTATFTVIIPRAAGY